ncbi:hypothetical protein LTR10_005741 [Elasticomyces elasticus]|nr:hypothetical protein LTR10_005741 [Elasticomyces elasticus]KAK4964949.1 hypothetical protein LTR42_012366 [Elasticomyces elasticus]
MARPLTNVLHHTSYPSISPADPSNSAAGKTVVISGGTGGIGYGIAQGFSAAGAANVVILARRQGALDEAAKRLADENAAAHRVTKVWPYLLDIRDPEATDRVFNAIRQRLNDEGPGENDIDILVANAAALTQGKTALDFETEAYRDAFETNVIGNLNLVRAFLAPEAPAIPLTNLKGETKITWPLRQSDRTKIVLDVSTSAWLVDIPGQAPYVASLIQTPGTSTLVKEGSDVPWDDVSLPSHFAVWLAGSAAAFTNGRFVMSSWDVDELMARRADFENDRAFCSISLKF